MSGPANASPPRPARIGSVRIVVAAALAVVAIGWGDRQLHQREDVVAAIRDRTGPFIPLSDVLADRVKLKGDFDDLARRRADALAAGDRDAFLRASYELSRFLAVNIAEDDERRREVLLDVIRRDGDQFAAFDAYGDLLLPAWRQDLAGSYADYTRACLAMSSPDPARTAQARMAWAASMKVVGRTDLELLSLRAARAIAPVSAATFNGMSRLLAIIPPTDGDRPRLQTEVEAYRARQEELIQSATWFNSLQAGAARSSDGQLLALWNRAPAGRPNSFKAAADVLLIRKLLRDGAFADAAKVRDGLADYDPSDLDDCAAAAAAASSTAAPVPLAPLPAEFEQYRALLGRRRFDDASRLAASIFVGPAAPPLRWARDEERLARGQFGLLYPIVALSPTKDPPAEFEVGSPVYGGTFDLLSADASAGGRSVARLWVSARLIVLQFDNDRPASGPAATRVSTPSGDTLIAHFNPDRWFDFEYALIVKSDGKLVQQRDDNKNVDGAYHPGAVHADLHAKLAPLSRGDAWAARIVLPRDRCIPPGPGFIRMSLQRTPVAVAARRAWGFRGGNSAAQGWVYLPG